MAIIGNTVYGQFIKVLLNLGYKNIENLNRNKIERNNLVFFVVSIGILTSFIPTGYSQVQSSDNTTESSNTDSLDFLQDHPPLKTAKDLNFNQEIRRNQSELTNESSLPPPPPPPPQLLTPSISIDNTNPANPQVQSDFTIEGSTVNPPSNLLIVNWGDGNIDRDVHLDNYGEWTASHVYMIAGSVQITATSCDVDNTCIDGNETIFIQPLPTPTISIDNTNPVNPLVGNKVSVEGSTTNAPSDSLTVGWGDDSDDTTVPLGDKGNWFTNHIYKTADEHLIKATLSECNIADNSDGSCFGTKTINVLPIDTDQPSISIDNTNPVNPLVGNKVLSTEPPQSPSILFWIVISVAVIIIFVVIIVRHKPPAHHTEGPEKDPNLHVPIIEVTGGVER